MRIGNRQRITPAAVTEQEVPLEVAVPLLVGCAGDDRRGALRGVTPVSSRSLDGEPLTRQQRTDRAGRRQLACRISVLQDITDQRRSPCRVRSSHRDELLGVLGADALRRAQRCTTLISQRRESPLLIAPDPLVRCLAADSVLIRQLGNRIQLTQPLTDKSFTFLHRISLVPAHGSSPV